MRIAGERRWRVHSYFNSFVFPICFLLFLVYWLLRECQMCNVTGTGIVMFNHFADDIP